MEREREIASEWDDCPSRTLKRTPSRCLKSAVRVKSCSVLELLGTWRMAANSEGSCDIAMPRTCPEIQNSGFAVTGISP